MWNIFKKKKTLKEQHNVVWNGFGFTLEEKELLHKEYVNNNYRIVENQYPNHSEFITQIRLWSIISNEYYWKNIDTHFNLNDAKEKLEYLTKPLPEPKIYKPYENI